MAKKKKIMIGVILTAVLMVAVLGWKLFFSFHGQVEPVDLSRHSRENGNPGLAEPGSAVTDTIIGTSHENYKIIQTRNFFDDANFQSAFQKKSTVITGGYVVAGLVNHHALAQDLIAGFFQSLRSTNQKIERIIIISPDHNKAGRNSVVSHLRPYAAPDGRVNVDAIFVEQLVEQNLIALDNGTMFENEHGVGALAPFLCHEFPGAKIVPLAIRGDAIKEDLRNFGRSLAGMLDENTIIIVSSDMSHYLPFKQALKNDEITLDWLKTSNFFELAKANDSYLDNGAAIAVLEGVFSEQKIQPKFLPLDHSISTEYGADPENTTSYIMGVWVNLSNKI